MRILGENNPQHSRTPSADKPKLKSMAKSEDKRVSQKSAPMKNLSDDEIIAKLKAKKSASEVKQTKETQEVSAEKEENAEEKDLLLKSDVGKNDPKDPVVKEKLKDILKSGAFSFSQKEKDVLSKIL